MREAGSFCGRKGFALTRRFLLLALCSGLWGCANRSPDPGARFSIGLYGVSEGHLEAARRAGFDTVLAGGDARRLQTVVIGKEGIVVQAYDWRDGPRKAGQMPLLGRFSDHREIRWISYLAVLRGAKGLFYSTLSKPGGKPLLGHPELWQVVARMGREISLMRPVFERGRRARLPFLPDPDGPEAGAWRLRGRDYVVLLNSHSNVMVKVPEELLSREWRPLFEVRRDPRDLLENVGGSWYLPPYRVMVFESRFRWPGS